MNGAMSIVHSTASNQLGLSQRSPQKEEAKSFGTVLTEMQEPLMSLTAGEPENMSLPGKDEEVLALLNGMVMAYLSDIEEATTTENANESVIHTFIEGLIAQLPSLPIEDRQMLEQTALQVKEIIHQPLHNDFEHAMNDTQLQWLNDVASLTENNEIKPAFAAMYKLLKGLEERMPGVLKQLEQLQPHLQGKVLPSLAEIEELVQKLDMKLREAKSGITSFSSLAPFGTYRSKAGELMSQQPIIARPLLSIQSKQTGNIPLNSNVGRSLTENPDLFHPTISMNKAEHFMLHMGAMNDSKDDGKLEHDFQQMLIKSALTENQTQSTLTIKLIPEDLGSLQLQVVNESDIITAKMTTSTEQAKNMLELKVPSLKQAFLNAQIPIENIELRSTDSSFPNDVQRPLLKESRSIMVPSMKKGKDIFEFQLPLLKQPFSNTQVRMENRQLDAAENQLTSAGEQFLLHIGQLNGKIDSVKLQRDFEQIVTKSSFNSNESHSSMSIRLIPEHLGLLQMEKVNEGDTTAVKITPSTKRAKDILEFQLPLLKQTFSNAQIRIENIPLNATENQLTSAGQSQLLKKNTGIPLPIQTSSLLSGMPTGKQEQPVLHIGQLNGKVDSVKLYRDFERILAGNSSVPNGSHSNMSIRLIPEHLGSLQVEWMKQGEMVVAKIVTSSQHMKEMLESQLSPWKQRLMGAKILLEKIQFHGEKNHQVQLIQSEDVKENHDFVLPDETSMSLQSSRSSKIEQFMLHIGQINGKMDEAKFNDEFKQIVMKSSLIKNGSPGKLTIRLTPEHLGSLQIELVKRGEAMIAKIVTSTQQAKELLESQLPSLKQALMHAQIQIEKIDILQQSQPFEQLLNDSDEQQDKRNQHFRQNETDDGTEDAEEQKSFFTALEEELLNISV